MKRKLVNVTVSGGGLSSEQFSVQSCTINYQIGSLPTCSLTCVPGPAEAGRIKAGDWSFLKTFEDMRRKDVVTVRARVTFFDASGEQQTSSVSFRGFIDGYGASQGVFSASFSLELVSELILLQEASTKYPGISNMGMRSFQPMMTASKSIGSNSKVPNIVNEDISKDDVVTAYKRMLQAFAKQFADPDKIVLDDTYATEAQQSVFLDYKNRLKEICQIYPTIGSMLDAVDVGRLKDSAQLQSVITGIDGLVFLYNSFLDGPEDFYGSLQSFYATLALQLIPVNRQLVAVIPSNTFLARTHKKPGDKEYASDFNVQFPADYSDFAYTDQGFASIGMQCILDPSTPVQNSNAAIGAMSSCVVQTFPKSAGGPSIPGWAKFGKIVYAQVPPVFGSSATATREKQALKQQESTYANANSFDKDAAMQCSGHAPTLPSDNVTQTIQQDNAKEEQEAQSRKALEGLQECTFYSYLYANRSGSLSMPFKNNWVPGLPGYLYTRSPGLWLDFMVQGVTHSFSVNDGSMNADTRVSFTYGRYSSDAKSSGVDRQEFYNYDMTMAKEVADAFLQQTS